MAEYFVTPAGDPQQVERNRILLKKIRYHMQRCASEDLLAEMMDDGQMDMFCDHVAGQFVAQYRKFIAGRDVHDATKEYPADWWQAFKLRWFPKWLLKRYPAKYNRWVVTVQELIPSIRTSYFKNESFYILEHRTIPPR